MQAEDRYYKTFPRVLGQDAAGTVEAVGSEVTSFKKNDRVTSFIPGILQQEPNTKYGGFQQYTLSSAVATSIIPDGVSFDAASTIPLAIATAADGLYRFLELEQPSGQNVAKKDEYVLVWGGASSVGQFAIQLLHHAGYKVITTASKANHDSQKSLGADVVIDYSDADAVDQINKVTGGKLRSVYDAVSNQASIPLVLKTLPNGGKVAFTQLTPETLNLESPSNIEYIRVFGGTVFTSQKEMGKSVFAWVSKALSDKTLQPNPVKLQSGGLGGVQETLDLYRKQGISNAKFVINP